MRTIILRPKKPFDIPVEAEVISPDKLAGLTLAQIGSLEAWQGNSKNKLSDLFRVEGDDVPVKPEETTVILEGDFSKVKRIAENMSAGNVEARGNVGMRAGSGMRGGVLRVQGNADDWLGREMRGGKIVVEGSVGNYAGAGYRGEKCGMRGGEMDVSGQAGTYLGEHMCGGNIRVGGDAGDFPGSANQGGTIIIGGSTYLPGAEMTKGSITIKGMAKMLPSYQKMELVEIEGANFQKYVGDLVENGKGEIYVSNPAQQSP
jgi:formylmethanofuran dehydrogenase subunit C